MKLKLLMLPLICLLICGCTKNMKSAVDKDGLKTKFSDTVIDGKYIWVRGIAAANPQHTTKTQKRAMSREGAIANAYQRAAEFVAGTAVYANVKVADAISKDSVLETKVASVVKQGEIVETEYTEDDGCTVILRIARQQIEALNIKLEDKK